MALDLGSLLSQGLSTYQAVQQAQAQQQPVFFSEAYDFLTDSPSVAAGVRVPCKRRRRRKRLATLSDIRDLAALQNILGKGEAFKTWIATHPS